jgi:hypothetical protein
VLLEVEQFELIVVEVQDLLKGLFLVQAPQDVVVLDVQTVS